MDQDIRKRGRLLAAAPLALCLALLGCSQDQNPQFGAADDDAGSPSIAPRDGAANPPLAADNARGADVSAMPTYPDYAAGRGVRVSELVGENVMGTGGDDIGEIKDVLISESPGGSPRVVISVGGGIGAESRLVAMPLRELHVADDEKLYVARTEEQVAAEPTFNYGPTTAAAQGASAQSSAAQGGANAPAGSATTTAAGQRVGSLLGAPVVDTSGEEIGEVDDIVIAANGADQSQAVLAIGGAAGIGEHLVAVPLSELQVSGTAAQGAGAEPGQPAPAAANGEAQVRVNRTAEDLKQMPEYQYDEGERTAAL